MTFTLRHRIAGLALLSAFLVGTVSLFSITHYTGDGGRAIVAETDRLTRATLGGEVLGVIDLLETANDLIDQRVLHGLRLAQDALAEAGGMQLGESLVEWDALDQTRGAGGQTERIMLPAVLIGETPIAQNRSFEVTTPFIDEIGRISDGTVTLFQRMNKGGSMLRAATNVRKLDGTRAIGTYIPAIMPDGTPNPVLKAVLAGETFHGRAFVVNAWYVTAYAPLFGAGGDVIGMIYTGVPQASVEPRKVVGRKTLGLSGWVGVMIGSGERAGEVVIGREGMLEGNLLQHTVDPKLAEALKQASTLPPREVHLVSHDRQPADPEGTGRVTALAYFAPWDWVVLGSAPAADFAAPKLEADRRMSRLRHNTTFAVLTIAALAACLAWFIGARIARPIATATRIAGHIAAGNMLAAQDALGAVRQLTSADRELAQGADETRQLENAMSAMTHSLNSLLGEVKSASVQLMSSANQITATVRLQEAAISEFRASTNEVATSTREISGTAQALESAVDEVSAVTNENSVVAGEGKTDLDQMRASMGLLSSTSSNVAARLRAIDEKAGDIHQVVSTITRVADQTNLLSLNAAIEAEKAGEFGTGFSVVAREIRRLADQTAMATLDIGSTVTEMQAAVNAGVGEMSRFEQLMSRSVEDTARLADRLDGIITRVEALAPRLQMIREGMRQQTQGATQISESMLQINEAASRTAESAKEMHNAANNLNQAVQEMQGEVARFTVA